MKPVDVENLSAADVAELLQWMATNVVPFAHALALAQGLTAEQSAERFRRGAYAAESVRTGLDRAVVAEDVARHQTQFYRAVHGHAILYQDGDAWLVESSLAAVRPEIEKWGVSLEYYVRWADGIDRELAKRDGITMETWLDGDALKLRVNA